MLEEQLIAGDLKATTLRVMGLAQRLCGLGKADVVLSSGYSVARGRRLDLTRPAFAAVRQAFGTASPVRVTRRCGRLLLATPVLRQDGTVQGALFGIADEARPCEYDTLIDLEDLARLVTDAFERQRSVDQLSRTTADLETALARTVKSEARLGVALRLAKVHVWDVDHTDPEVGGNDLPPLEAGITQVNARVDMWAAMHPADRPAAQALWDRHLAEGVPYQVHHRVVRRDGPHVWLEAASEAIRGPDGKVVRVVGAYRNIDREKRAALELEKARDAAQAANEAKSAFLATMSHEIRTPLNGVLGMAQAMVADDLAPVQRERLDVIRQSGETLLVILNDILDLSKIEAGKFVLEEVEFDFEALAGGVHAAFSAVAAGKGVDLSVSVGRGARGAFHGDPIRIRQVLSNLVSNAIKFTESGGVSVGIGRVKGAVRILVRDTGIGISPETAQRLFEKFEQADASTTRRFGGTGLGLAICRDLVELMGGAIAFRSRAGGGSAFAVTLPLQRVKGGMRPAGSAPRPIAQTGSAAPLRVLAAEDNPVNQMVLRTLLNQLGVDPTIVENGVDAVAVWESGDWDAILMDVQMPRMDGPTATQFIRSRERALGRPRTPIIALTANSMPHQVAEYLAAGMDAFVGKPIEIGVLFETLQAVVATPASAEAIRAA